MNRTEKQAFVGELNKTFSAMKACVLADFHGVNVAQMEDIRRDAREHAITFKVIKNRLCRKGVEGTNAAILSEYFKGQTCIAYSFEDEIQPAKVIVKYAKDGNGPLRLKVGYVTGKIVEPKEVQQLAELPSREELLGRMCGSLNAPISGFVNVLAGNIKKVIWVLAAIRDKKEQ